MTRRSKKVQDKRVLPTDEPRKPAGIQSMDLKLYEAIQQAVRGMTCASVTG